MQCPDLPLHVCTDPLSPIPNADAETEGDRQKFELLLQEKNEQEMEYEEKLKMADDRAQSQLSALDAQYQAKIMAEVERFQQLTQEKELLNERCV